MTSTRAAGSRDAPLDGRDESADERADRNWIEVLQELRVLQTGSQILTGFLLALAFQPGFTDLSDRQRNFYLALVVVASLTAIIALAPVAIHRGVFRKRMKRGVVGYGHAALVADPEETVNRTAYPGTYMEFEFARAERQHVFGLQHEPVLGHLFRPSQLIWG